MSTISASTTSTTAYKVTADTTGTLVLQTGSTPTTAVTIGTDQSVTTAGTINSLTVGRGAGSVSTNTAVGASALAANTTGASNTSFGYQAGNVQTTANDNTLIGTGAGSKATGGSNTAVGSASLGTNAGSTTGVSNAAFGLYSLTFLTSGSYNTAFGQDTLRSNTTASNNTAVGYQAGYSNQTGARNTIIGYLAGYNLTGSFNTLVGSGTSSSAGDQITSGTKNTVLGAYNGNQGGLDIRTASNFIVLSDGDGNPRLIGTAQGNFYLGTNSSAPSTNYAGSFLVGNGNSTIGSGSVNPTILFGNAYSTGSGIPVFVGNWAAANNWGVGLHDGTGNRRVRIGGSTLATGGHSWDGTYADIYAGAYTNASDYRIKENVVELADGALSAILSLRPVKYNIISQPDDETPNRTEIGFIAHELQEHIPELVTGEKDAVDMNGIEMHQGVDYAKLTAVLAKAIQEQQAIIETLTNRITALEAK